MKRQDSVVVKIAVAQSSMHRQPCSQLVENAVTVHRGWTAHVPKSIAQGQFTIPTLD